MVVLETAAVLSGLKDTFLYNRDNYMFNRKMDQEKIYHRMRMRISQVRLFRDDIRDLFELTIKKMDHYLLINALLLLFAGGFFYEGRLPTSSPAWLLWLWTMAIGSTITFLSLSIWFAVHASITAQTFAVRLLTQWLRLPIPGYSAIAAAGGTAADFERGSGSELLRPPVLPSLDVTAPLTESIIGKSVGDLNAREKAFTMANEPLQAELADDYTLFVEHFHLFSDLQKHWNGYDAYARVCMAVGTNQFFSAIGYMGLAYFLLEMGQWGSIFFLIVLQTFALFHALLNLRLSKNEKIFASIFVFLPSLLSIIAAGSTVIAVNKGWSDPVKVARWLSPFINFLSLSWMIFLLHMGSDSQGGLPFRFVTVQSIDVLGLDGQTSDWLDGKIFCRQEEPVAFTVPQAEVVQRGEAVRRGKIDRQILEDEKIPNAPSSPISERSDPAPVISRRFSFLGMTLGGPSLPAHEDDFSDDSFEGGLKDQKGDARYFKASGRAMRLPWHSFNQAGSVIVALWLFSVVYSILVICGIDYGWPNTYPSSSTISY